MYKTVQINYCRKVLCVTAEPCVLTSVPLTYVWAFGFVGFILFSCIYVMVWLTNQQYVTIVTSSTAQGGGGSFKNRKPIGEVGCCESGMAERSHWWTERCLRSPLFLFLWLSTYLPIYLLCIYLSICLSVCLSVYLSISLSLSLSSNYLSIYLSICLPVYLSICGAVSFSVM